MRVLRRGAARRSRRASPSRCTSARWSSRCRARCSTTARRTWGPGDVIITNDPYPSGVHLNDISLISPVHARRRAARLRREPGPPRRRRRRRAGVDRRVPRGVPGGRDHPAGQAGRGGGRLVDDVFALILAQIRSKHETAGDLRAQVAANATGVRRVQALVARHGRETVTGVMDELLAYTERRTRAELAALPHGVFEAEGRSTRTATRTSRCGCGRGSRSRPTASASTSPAAIRSGRAPVNSTYAQTFSACAYAVKCLVDPDLPVNDGFYRLVGRRARGDGRQLHLADAGRRRLGDADPARRRDLPRAPPGAARAAAGGNEGDDVPRGLRRRRRGERRVHLLPRDVRRRLRRPVRRATGRTRCRRTARTPRTRRSRRPS